jgi:hypothetical protein
MWWRRLYKYLLLIGSGGLLLQTTTGCAPEEVINGLFELAVSMVVQQAFSKMSF